jgi:hypothetical protein
MIKILLSAGRYSDEMPITLERYDLDNIKIGETQMVVPVKGDAYTFMNNRSIELDRLPWSDGVAHLEYRENGGELKTTMNPFLFKFHLNHTHRIPTQVGEKIVNNIMAETEEQIFLMPATQGI